MLKALLQGKPIRHPLHPILIHFPIGLFVLSLLLDVGSFAAGGNWLVRGSFYSMAFGIVLALAAAVPGFVDYFDIRADHPAKKIGTYHMLLNLLMVALYIVNLGLRYGQQDVAQAPPVPFVLSLCGMGILGVSGYLGGMMVYDDGIAVGRHRRHTDTPGDTLHLSSALATADGFVPVADVARLPEEQTLRVDLNGTVIVIAHADGQFYAFQEFCTHRYGPLSLGCFKDGQVECPWHRSCFDMRTGKETHGPAELDLKTFEVSVRDGKIHVRVPAERVGRHAESA